ncbi:hypothetical protein KFE25_012369 [Diacronema lutheri]|uniref:Uncharacterized protein n=1 Tax=Diacronema lutheri TaxID=2081491 RepID=A0A8J6CBD6_DIALT|nr:hypothetical protein KFE25_012369 [Diacronema lutheri]
MSVVAKHESGVPPLGPRNAHAGARGAPLTARADVLDGWQNSAESVAETVFGVLKRSLSFGRPAAGVAAKAAPGAALGASYPLLSSSAHVRDAGGAAGARVLLERRPSFQRREPTFLDSVLDWDGSRRAAEAARRDTAATRVQAAARARRARLERARAAAAVLRIQATARGLSARELVRARHRAATRAQAGWRGRAGRAEARRRRATRSVGAGLARRASFRRHGGGKCGQDDSADRSWISRAISRPKPAAGPAAAVGGCRAATAAAPSLVDRAPPKPAALAVGAHRAGPVSTGTMGSLVRKLSFRLGGVDRASRASSSTSHMSLTPRPRIATLPAPGAGALGFAPLPGTRRASEADTSDRSSQPGGSWAGRQASGAHCVDGGQQARSFDHGLRARAASGPPLFSLQHGASHLPVAHARADERLAFESKTPRELREDFVPISSMPGLAHARPAPGAPAGSHARTPLVDEPSREPSVARSAARPRRGSWQTWGLRTGRV